MELIKEFIVQDIFVKSETKDYDTWFKIFSAPGSPTREEYGIHLGGLYRDTKNPNTALLHFQVEDMARMLEYLSLPEFKKFSEEGGVVNRTVWTGTKKDLF